MESSAALDPMTPPATSGAAWSTCAEALTEASLRALIAGEIAAIRVAGFATAGECESICRAIVKVGAGVSREAQTARMTLFGVNFSNYDGMTREGYFEQVEPSYALVGEILAQARFDPLERMLQRLRAVWPAQADVAEEPGFGRYFAGGIKTRTSTGNLHYDYVPHTAAGFRIADVEDQLGWNLYLDMPHATGHTVLHGREVPRTGGPAGKGAARALNLDHAFVAGAPTYTFHPHVGDVVIINTRYPHDIVVEGTLPGESRTQVSSFIGRLPDDELLLWS